MIIENQIVRHHFDTLDSTNEFAKEHLANLPSHFIHLFTASKQTKGKGTKGKNWFSPKDLNIYASYGFKEDNLSYLHLSSLGLMFATVICSVLSRFCLNQSIKWPNDILIGGKKIGGILVETTKIDESIGVIIGFGININSDEKLFSEISQPATSLYHETGKYFEIDEILDLINNRFLIDLSAFVKKGFSPFCSYFNSLMIYKNYPVFEDSILLGYAKFIETDGYLVIETPKNEYKKIANGSIKLR